MGFGVFGRSEGLEGFGVEGVLGSGFRGGVWLRAYSVPLIKGSYRELV